MVAGGGVTDPEDAAVVSSSSPGCVGSSFTADLHPWEKVTRGGGPSQHGTDGLDDGSFAHDVSRRS